MSAGSVMGDIHHHHRLTDREKIEIVNERLYGDLTYIEIAEKYKISTTTAERWRGWARKFGFEIPSYRRRIPQRKPKKNYRGGRDHGGRCLHLLGADRPL